MHQFVADVLKIYLPWLRNFYKKRGFQADEIEVLIQGVSLRFYQHVQKTNLKTGANPLHPKEDIGRLAKWEMGSFLEKKIKIRRRETSLEFHPIHGEEPARGNQRRVRQIICDACKNSKMARDVYLRFIEKWQVATIAQFAEEPVTTIRGRINRGKKALFSHIARQLGIPSAQQHEWYQAEMEGATIADLAAAGGEAEDLLRARIAANRKKVFCWILKE